MPAYRRLLLAALLTLLACAPPVALSPDAAALLARPAEGALIYRGRVSPQGQERPAFIYTRHVARDAQGLTSIHTTRDAATDQIVVSQRAWHAEDYTLRRFEEVHAQTGVVSGVRVLSDGALEFHHVEGDARERAIEAAGAGEDVVVGPTLFGYVLTRWDSLLAGHRHTIRFAATDRMRSYRFTLRATPRSGDAVTVVMEASDQLVRWMIAPIQITFDARERRPLRYSGAVPPRDPDGDAITARVVYEQGAGPFY